MWFISTGRTSSALLNLLGNETMILNERQAYHLKKEDSNRSLDLVIWVAYMRACKDFDDIVNQFSN